MARLAELGYWPVHPSTLSFFLSIDLSETMARLAELGCRPVYPSIYLYVFFYPSVYLSLDLSLYLDR